MPQVTDNSATAIAHDCQLHDIILQKLLKYKNTYHNGWLTFSQKVRVAASAIFDGPGSALFSGSMDTE